MRVLVVSYCVGDRLVARTFVRLGRGISIGVNSSLRPPTSKSLISWRNGQWHLDLEDYMEAAIALEGIEEPQIVRVPIRQEDLAANRSVALGQSGSRGRISWGNCMVLFQDREESDDGIDVILFDSDSDRLSRGS